MHPKECPVCHKTFYYVTRYRRHLEKHLNKYMRLRERYYHSTGTPYMLHQNAYIRSGATKKNEYRLRQLRTALQQIYST